MVAVDTLTLGPIRIGGEVIADSMKLKISDTVMLLSMRRNGKLIHEEAVLLPHEHVCIGCGYALECVQPNCLQAGVDMCNKCKGGER